MKKYLSLLVALAVILFSFSSFAFTPPAKPADGWYVLDQAGKLSTDQVSQLNQKIESLNKTTKNEYAVAILSTLDGNDIADAAQATFRSWGVGKKGLNNGVLLMISVGDRKTRIQTGKGAEGDLPDLFCSDVLSNTLKPRLKAGQWYAGVNDTIDALAGHMESRAKPEASKPDSATGAATPKATHSGGCAISPGSDSGSGTGVLIVLLLTAVGGTLFYARRRNKAEQEALARLDEQNAEWERSLRSAQRLRDEQRALEMAHQRDKELDAARTFVPKAVPLPLPIPMSRPVLPPVALSSGTPRIPRPEGVPTAPVAKSSGLSTTEKVGLGVAGVAAAALAADALLEQSKRRREEEAQRRRREEEEENDRQRRQREDDDRRSSYSSSSSSYDSGSSSSSWDSGGSGFGGGDSGGGGSSGDF